MAGKKERKKTSNVGDEKKYGDSYHICEERSRFVDISSGAKHRKKGIRNVKNAVIITISILCAIVGGILVYSYYALNTMNYQPLEDDTGLGGFLNASSGSDEISLTLGGKDPLNDPMVLNVLLFGSDSYSAGDGGRTDSMMLVSVDSRRKKIKLTSFLRDLWVTIPGHGQDRLNAAYAVGGAQLAIETVEKNFGIHIDRYIVADFPGFEAVVNRLGGIDIELTEEEVRYINTHCDDKNKLKGAGLHHLTGLQALTHARNRDSAMSDFDRTTRQRQVVESAIRGIKEANLGQITRMISDVGYMITTNFRKNEVAILTKNSLTYLAYPVSEYSLPTLDNFSNAKKGGAAVLVVNDIKKAKKDLAYFIYEDSIKETVVSTGAAGNKQTKSR